MERSINIALKEVWYRKNELKTQYWGPQIGLIEKMGKDLRIKKCPICGFKLLVSGTTVQEALRSDGSCRVCDTLERDQHMTIKEE